jgi:hypothetical protein|eukprot:COSAG01_NODE_81467_length_111_cov_38.500000_1_plen_37_part_11
MVDPGVVGGLYIGTTGVACYKKMVFLSTNSPLPHRVT